MTFLLAGPEVPLDDFFLASQPSQWSAGSGSSQMSYATASGHDTCPPSTQTSETWRSGGTFHSSAGTMPSSAGHAARNLPPRDQFHIDGLDDEEEAGEEPHVSYDRPWSTQPPAGSHHPEPSQHAVVDSHDGHHSDNVDLLAGLRHNEGRFDRKAADDGSESGAETGPEDEPEPAQRMPNWYYQNMQRAALNAQAGGTETGPLEWMILGLRTAGHQRLDAGHIDALTGNEVKGEIKRSLDAHERDINSPSPHMIFKGREYFVLVEEATAPNGVTVTTFVAEVSKSQLEQVRKQLGPRQLILRAMQGVYYCQYCWEGVGCGCFFALSFSRNTCSHSVHPLGTVQMSGFTAARQIEFPFKSLRITSTFTAFRNCTTTGRASTLRGSGSWRPTAGCGSCVAGTSGSKWSRSRSRVGTRASRSYATRSVSCSSRFSPRVRTTTTSTKWLTLR